MTHKKRPHSIDFAGEISLTKQSFRDQCDINIILKNYENTGMISHTNKSQGTYGDFTGISDYQSSLNAVITAQNSFNELPAGLRKYFDNDPAKLIQFISDDKNYDQAYKLGLISEETYSSKLPQKIEPLTDAPK